MFVRVTPALIIMYIRDVVKLFSELFSRLD